MMTIAPVVKDVTVPLGIEEAFTAFIDEMAEWWPLATHSVAGDQATGVAVGAGVGGQIVETAADGSTHVWGTVTAWSRPERVAFTWHPGSSPDTPTHVELEFSPAGPGRTRVVLIHTGWENWQDGADARERYSPGWDFVVGRFVTRAGG